MKFVDNLDFQIQEKYEWEKWLVELPYLQFKEYMRVQIIPPLTGAIIRFHIQHKDNPKYNISVYFDAYNTLGYAKRPYWELYPNEAGDVTRFYMEEYNELIEEIGRLLLKEVANE